MWEIGDYIHRELRNPEAARRMMRRFREAMAPLQQFLEIGAPQPITGEERCPYRYLVCGS